MDTIQGTKTSSRNSWSLVVGLLSILLALPGTGFSATSVLDPTSSYFFASTSYDSAGLESVYFDVINNNDPVPPTVAIDSTSDSAPSNGIVPISVNLPDTIGITKVQLFVNDILNSETTQSPYAFPWDTSTLVGGDYNIVVKAFDAAGNQQASDKLTVTVAGDTTPPTVTLSAPAVSGAASVVVSASASDNVNVARVEIYLDDTLVSSSSQSSASYTWETGKASNGSHLLSAKAYDTAGNVGVSSPVTVTVSNDTTAPVVSIGAPGNSSTVSGSVTVSASASDNVAVSRVEFSVNGSLKQAVTSAPYSFVWNTAGLANGSYTLTASAYDATGNIGRSSGVNVNVFNDTTAPTVNSFSMSSGNTTTVAVTNFTASDNVGVTGYLITESTGVPAANAAGWTLTAPASFVFTGTGARTAYAWAKDAAGNISAGSSASVLIDTTPPVISYLALLCGTSDVTVKVSATDNVAVTRLQVYVDDSLQLESTSGSLRYVLGLTSNGHTITVKAYDAAGNVRSQSLRIHK